jgi:RNA polymerase sigma factor (sigma-70 family)
MGMAEQATFEEAFADLYRAGFRAAYRVTGDAEASEDAASEALVRAGLRWRSIVDRELPFVVRVATNLAIDHVRRQARVVRADPSEQTDPGAEPAYRELDLHRALQTLPKRQRQVVVLRYFGDLTERQIAGELGIAEGTVKSHASRGLAALRLSLDPQPALAAPHPEERTG